MNLKKVGNYVSGTVPGVGLVSLAVREIKKRRGRRPWYNIRKLEDWKDIGKLSFQVTYLSFAIFSKAYLLPTYIGNGRSTGEWHPLKQKRAKTEQMQSIQESKLEKTIRYEELLDKTPR